ncbi:MAG TPA: hypothetical protein PKV13_05490 [Propionicimonas sp.]|nr:hypothetical protein [Propionicimonas sp.]HRA06056.1 hypothetical protein [Propionicimonas sp.]
MRRPAHLTTAITIAAFLLAGCSGLPGSAPAATLKAEDSPLTKYLYKMYQGPGPDASKEEQQTFYNELQKKTEDLVAQCMKKEGFEYTPNVSQNTVVMADGAENAWKPDDREWVQQYGYGMVNYPGRDDQQTETEATAPVDPNQQYLESLSEAEQQAYNEALYGTQVAEEPAEEEEATGEATETTWDWTKAGCYGAAQHESQGEQVYEKAEFKPLVDALQKFYETMRTSPEYAAMDTEWVACMDAAGKTGFKAQADASNSISELMNAYWESSMPAEGEEQTEAPTNQGTMDDPAFAEINKKEVELALVDLTCREKTDYSNRQLKIQFKLEEQFIADHKAELDAMVAAVEQGKK